jgi:hypothetical protein
VGTGRPSAQGPSRRELLYDWRRIMSSGGTSHSAPVPVLNSPGAACKRPDANGTDPTPALGRHDRDAQRNYKYSFDALANTMRARVPKV